MDFETYRAALGMMASIGTTMFSIFLGFLIFIISSGARISGVTLFLLTTGIIVSIIVAAAAVVGVIVASEEAFNPAFVGALACLLFVALGSVFMLATLAVKQVLEDLA